MKYFVYILECSDKTLYTGITCDLNRRIEEHNNSKRGARYTKMRRPVVLRYFEELNGRGSAQKRESYIKKLSRQGKLLILNKK